MTTHHFSITANPALFLEILNPASPTSAPTRPPAGVVVKVRRGTDQTALPDTATLAGGYLDFSVDDAASSLAVEISADNGVNWAGPFWSTESSQSAMDSGAKADAATAAVSTLTNTVTSQGTTLTGLVNTRIPTVETAAASAGTAAAAAQATADQALASSDGNSARLRLVAVDGQYPAKDSSSQEADYIGSVEPPIGGVYASGTDIWYRTEA